MEPPSYMRSIVERNVVVAHTYISSFIINFDSRQSSVASFKIRPFYHQRKSPR